MSDVKTASPRQVHRDFVLSPITALAFYRFKGKQYLLAAEDTSLKVYDVASAKICGTLPIFQGQSIHGISVPTSVNKGSEQTVPSDRHESCAPRHILIWGGHIVKILPTRIIEDLISSTNEENASNSHTDILPLQAAALAIPETITPDWIFTGRISPFGDQRVVLLTAHNEVIQCRIHPAQSILQLGRLQSPSRPILYSGDLCWTEPDCLLVAAGTVFGEIIAWNCHLDSYSEFINPAEAGAEGAQDGANETAGCEILSIYSGHEGSIFGVHISSEIRLSSGEIVRLLGSCSDDRTIRLWRVPQHRNGTNIRRNAYDTRVFDARETGFGDSIVGSLNTSYQSSACVAMAMGHISRIWQVEIRSSCSLSEAGLLQVYSFGEDATMQKWNLDLKDLESRLNKPMSEQNSSGPPVQLIHQETFSNHSGKQIWSHATVPISYGLLIATGGADGKIALVEHQSDGSMTAIIENTEEGYSKSSQEFEMSASDLLQLSHSGIDDAPMLSTNGRTKDTIQSFTFVREDSICIATKRGCVFMGALGDDSIDWKVLTILDTTRQVIQSYSLLRRSKRASIAFLAATSGELFYYHESDPDSMKLLFKAERKITEIFCISDAVDVDSEQTELLITPFGSSNVVLLHLDGERHIISQHEVSIPDGYVATSAAWCHSYLIIGFRNSSISIFEKTSEGHFSLLLTVKLLNKSDRITSILALPRRSESHPHYFLTTCRDGKYRIHEIIREENIIAVRLLHEIIPPIGPMLEGSWLVDNTDGTQDLMLCGFRSQNFVVWNATKQIEVKAIDTANGHRVFDYMTLRDNPNGLRFAFAKASQVKIVSETHVPHTFLKQGGHGREIKAISSSGRFVATGAEDTTIRLWELSSVTGTLRCVHTLEKHTTGIQKLKWYKDQYLFSSGGNEQFYIWRINHLESDVCPLGVVCEAVFPDRSEVGDLRILDFDVGYAGTTPCNENQGQEVEDSTTKREDPMICISMALSNSTVQSYLYSSGQGFKLLGRRTYTGACIIQLRHLEFSHDGYSQILAAATDGHLIVFTSIRALATEESADILVSRLHQSGIKSLDLRRVQIDKGASYLVVTGGDDTAIGMVHLHFEQPSQVNVSLDADLSGSISTTLSNPYKIQQKFIFRSAHAAAVTGLAILDLENGGRDAVVVSTSNDQRVKTWRLVDWWNNLRVQLLDDQYSGVADAGDLEVLSEIGSSRKEDGKAGCKRFLVAGVGIEVYSI
ncbi:WD40-repeat-containing domain protein [Xylariaceae sp. FL0255]|nr:WD40-repeat-containing domain protein [Xylariaceae sp. FL0255]